MKKLLLSIGFRDLSSSEYYGRPSSCGVLSVCLFEGHFHSYRRKTSETSPGADMRTGTRRVKHQFSAAATVVVFGAIAGDQRLDLEIKSSYLNASRTFRN